MEEGVDSAHLLGVLQNENLSLRAVSPDNVDYYLKGLQEKLRRKREEVHAPLWPHPLTAPLCYVEW